MRHPFALLGALLSLCFVGCSGGPSHIEGISEGMNKADVVAVLGEPRTVSTVTGSEYLTFKVWRSFWRRQPGNYRDVHYVKFTGGRVVEYGDIRTLPENTRSQLKE
jgi:hypothetical protein